MKQEIRERIEKIRTGEVPEGYKKTKVGIIPEDWKVIKLKEIGSFSKGKGISKSDVINCGKGCVRYGEIYTSHHVFIKNFKSFISDEDASNSKLISKGDILFAGSGETAEEIGKAVCYMMDDEAYAGGDIIILSPENKNNYFYGYVLNHNLVNKQTRIKGQGQSVVHIYSKDLESVRIPKPFNYEENKIAEILSTWDMAIELKEKLIEEKKEFKRGLMQKLLTGGTRFPEFTDEWEEKKIGIICEIKKGIQINKTEFSFKGEYGVLNGGISPSGYTTEWNTKENTITISEGGNSCGFVNFNKDKFWCGGHCYALTNVKINNLLLYYILKYEEKKIMQLRVGSGLPNIQKKDLIKFILLIPKNVDEQEKIAKILHLISIEIITLINELNQLKEQKRGLMQLLLTGIVRVEVD